MSSSKARRRLTYPRIESQAHPLATGKAVARSLSGGLSSPTRFDIAIAKEVLSIQDRLRTVSGATGEWKWINEHKRGSYLKLLEEGDENKLAGCLVNMFRNDASYGIISSDFGIAKRNRRAQRDLEDTILLDLDALEEFDEGASRAQWLANWKTCGNLYGYLTSGNTLISVDAPRHRYFAGKIIRLLHERGVKRPVVFEIGGGYGGLALELFRSSRRRVTYINCDLPETLYLCYFFLRKTLPKVRIAWAVESMPKADIILVPAAAKHLVQKADLIFNANSLSEMGWKTMEGYIGVLHRLRPHYFLHQNSNYLLFPNSKRHIEILASEFPIKRSLYRKVYASVSPWQGAGGRYREYLYERNN